MSSTKTNPGRFFEDFKLGETIVHATPRTITEGARTLYTALYSSRFAIYSSDQFARNCGFSESPLEDLIGFHVAFGKTVPDVSLNAVANLGYADCRFIQPVFPGDTISTISEVIGLKENSNGKTGIVWVRSTASDQMGDPLLTWVRWVHGSQARPRNRRRRKRRCLICQMRLRPKTSPIRRKVSAFRITISITPASVTASATTRLARR